MNKIPEEKLNIPGDYQYKALQSKNVWLSNWHRNKMVAVSSLIKGADKKNLLDIGAGSGIFEYLYSKDFNSITAMDHHEKAVRFISKMARQNNLDNVEIKKLKIREVSKLVPKNRYDVVLLLDVIEHIDNKTIAELLKHVGKIITRNGIFIVTTPNYKGIWPITECVVERFGLVPRMSNVQHINKFNKKSLLSKFSEFGYKNTFLTTINTYSFLFPNKALAKKLVSLEMRFYLPFGNLLLGAFRFDPEQDL